MTRPSRRAEVLAPALVLALGAGLLWRLWAAPGLLCSARSDFVAQGAGLRALALKSLASGRFPLWDPSCDAGMPAHANPLATYLLPLDWLYLALPFDRATNLIFLLNALLAGAAMYACARRWLKSPWAAAFCGASYMLAFRFLALFDAGWLPTVMLYALAPLLLLTLDRAIERPGPGRSAALAATLAACLMQGSMQSLYYALLAGAAFAAARLARRERPARPRVLAWLAAGGLVGVFLAAPDLLPRLQFAALSTRMTPSWRFFLNDAPRWTALKTLLAPFDAGGTRYEYWENCFYFGAWLYPLWAWALARDRRRAGLLFGLTALFVLLCFDTPLLRLAYEAVPGFRLFRRPTRLLQLAQLTGVLLAGLGVDDLLGRLRPRPAAAAGLLLCLLPVLDAGARIVPRLTTRPLAEALPEPAFADLLRRAPGNGRVAEIGRAALPYGQAAYFGIDMVNGYEPLNLRDFVEYFDVLQHGDARRARAAPVVWTDLTAITRPDLLRALDARWIVSEATQPLAGLGWEPAGEREGAPAFDFYRGWRRATVRLWRDSRPWGPAFFARSLTPVRTERESLAALEASRSARDAVVLGWGGAAPAGLRGGSVRETRRGYGVSDYAVDSRGANFLVLSQVWYPGWRARLDGRPLALYRTDHALLGAEIPDGRHELALEMTSPALEWGLLLAALGGAAFAALAAAAMLA